MTEQQQQQQHCIPTNLSFENGTFDVVFAGNVTSLVSNRDSALKEYWRVLKENGYLVAVPMYYLEDPSDELLNNVRKAIQVNISVQHKEDWKKFFLRDSDELFEEVDFKFLKCSDEEINKFCDDILSRDHLKELSSDAMDTLRECYYNFMHLFVNNL